MSETIFPKEYKTPPWKLALAVFGICLVGMLIIQSTDNTGEWEWAIAAMGIMFFSWVNPFLNIFHDKWGAYVLQSIVLFIALTFALLFAAKFISPDRLADHKVYRVMIPVAYVFFIMTTLVSRIIKAIYVAADKST